MKRVFLLLGLLTALGAATVRAQDEKHWDRLWKQVQFDPERTLPESDERPDEETLLRMAARAFGLPASLPSTAPYAILGDQVSEWIESRRFEKRLEEITELLQQEEAELILPSMQDRFGSEALTSRGRRGVLLERLSRLPPSLVERYRRNIEAEAQHLLLEGERTRSPGPLRRLVRDHFASASAGKALSLLGDLAFERGRFEEALTWWRLLDPLPSQQLLGRGGDLRYPAATHDHVHHQAKQILALVFLNRFREAEGEVAALRKLAGTARGRLAGREGVLADIVADWLARRRPLAAQDDDEPWPTLGGSPTRNRVLSAAPRDRLWLDGEAWRAPLPASDRPPPNVWISPARSLAVPIAPYYPIIVEGQVVLSDGHRVISHDLLTGKERFRYQPAEMPEAGIEAPPSTEPLRFTVSADRGQVFARLARPRGGRADGSFMLLVALDLLAPKTGQLAWQAEATVPEGKAVGFESDPLAHDGHVYITLGGAAEGKRQSYLNCYDRSGSLRWQARLAELPDAGREAERSRRPDQLVWTETAVAVLSPRGWAMACDAWTGQRLWALRYPRVESAVSPREPSTALYAEGRVFLAPADGTHLYALDSDSGRVLWERLWIRAPSDVVPGEPVPSEVAHLLGVVEGRLIFTDRYRLQALDAATGNVVWQQPALGKLPGLGRGLIAGSFVIWPTGDPQVSWRAVTHARGSLRVFAGEDDPDPEYYDPTSLRGVPAGNIAIGEGCLVIAGPTELVTYVPLSRQLPRLERDAGDARVEPATLYKLALAQLETGRSQRAEVTLNELWSRISFVDRPAWEALLRQRRGTSPAPKYPGRHAVRTPASAIPTVEPPSSIGKLTRRRNPVPGFAPPIVREANTRADDRVVVWQSGSLIAVDARTGEECWRQPWVDQPLQWLGRTGGVLLAAGPRGLSAYRADDGQDMWNFVPPDVQAERWLLSDGQPLRRRSAGGLLGIDLRESQVVCRTRQGSFVLDRGTGNVTLARIGSIPGLEENGDLVPPNDDRSRVGHVPLREGRQVILANGDIVRGLEGGCVVRESAARTGKVWTYQPAWPTSLTGAAPQVMANGEALLALIPRNQGHELVRLNATTGESIWVRPVHELLDGFDVATAILDRHAVIYPYRGELVARTTDRGDILWKASLPSVPARWQLEAWGDTVLAWPQVSAGIPMFPGPGSALMAPLIVAWGRRGIGSVPVLVVDAQRGTLRQRLDLLHDRGPVLVHTQGSNLVVTAGGMVSCFRPD